MRVIYFWDSPPSFCDVISYIIHSHTHASVNMRTLARGSTLIHNFIHDTHFYFVVSRCKLCSFICGIFILDNK